MPRLQAGGCLLGRAAGQPACLWAGCTLVCVARWDTRPESCGLNLVIWCWQVLHGAGAGAPLRWRRARRQRGRPRLPAGRCGHRPGRVGERHGARARQQGARARRAAAGPPHPAPRGGPPRAPRCAAQEGSVDGAKGAMASFQQETHSQLKAIVDALAAPGSAFPDLPIIRDPLAFMSGDPSGAPALARNASAAPARPARSVGRTLQPRAPARTRCFGRTLRSPRPAPRARSHQAGRRQLCQLRALAQGRAQLPGAGAGPQRRAAKLHGRQPELKCAPACVARAPPPAACLPAQARAPAPPARRG